MPSCQWELEPEVFVFTVHRVYTLLIHLCPLIRSAHFQVMDDVCSNPPFYYANPFNGAPRLKRCHISWQLAPPPPPLDQLHRLLWVDQAQMRKCGKSDQVKHFSNRLTQCWSSPFHRINLCFAAYRSFWMLLPVLILLCWVRQQWCVQHHRQRPEATVNRFMPTPGLCVFISLTNISRRLAKMFQLPVRLVITDVTCCYSSSVLILSFTAISFYCVRV